MQSVEHKCGICVRFPQQQDFSLWPRSLFKFSVRNLPPCYVARMDLMHLCKRYFRHFHSNISPPIPAARQHFLEPFEASGWMNTKKPVFDHFAMSSPLPRCRESCQSLRDCRGFLFVNGTDLLPARDAETLSTLVQIYISKKELIFIKRIFQKIRELIHHLYAVE